MHEKLQGHHGLGASLGSFLNFRFQIFGCLPYRVRFQQQLELLLVDGYCLDGHWLDPSIVHT